MAGSDRASIIFTPTLPKKTKDGAPAGSPFEFELQGWLYGEYFQKTFATWDLYADFRTTMSLYYDDPNNLFLVPVTDNGTDGQHYRDVEYVVETKNGKAPKETWYVTEHQTNHELAKPDGMSGGDNRNEFDDEIGCGNGCAGINSLQTFTISRIQGINGQPDFSIIVDVPGLGDFGTLGIFVAYGGSRINGLLHWPGVPFPPLPPR